MTYYQTPFEKSQSYNINSSKTSKSSKCTKLHNQDPTPARRGWTVPVTINSTANSPVNPCNINLFTKSGLVQLFTNVFIILDPKFSLIYYLHIHRGLTLILYLLKVDDKKQMKYFSYNILYSYYMSIGISAKVQNHKKLY